MFIETRTKSHLVL